jgi:hypothetical protein
VNAPAKCLNLLGLSATSQGSNYEYSFVYVLLKLLAVSPPGATFSNPVTEVLYLLREHHETPAYKRLEQMLNTAKDSGHL